MYYKTKILSEEVRNTASKIAEADMNFSDFAKTSYGFEKAYASMKKRPDVFFRYLKYLESSSLCNLYKNSELSYQIMMGILLTLKHNASDEESVKVVISYLQDITKTKNFGLIKKFFKKSDKEDLALFFKSLRDTYSHLLSTVDLEKLYF
jgi:hypothetical protein